MDGFLNESEAGYCIVNYYNNMTRQMKEEHELIHAIENYIYFYNHTRFQKRLHCMTPIEFHYAYAA